MAMMRFRCQWGAIIRFKFRWMSIMRFRCRWIAEMRIRERRGILMDHGDVDVLLTQVLHVHAALLVEHNVLHHLVRDVTPGCKITAITILI